MLLRTGIWNASDGAYRMVELPRFRPAHTTQKRRGRWAPKMSSPTRSTSRTQNPAKSFDFATSVVGARENASGRERSCWLLPGGNPQQEQNTNAIRPDRDHSRALSEIKTLTIVLSCRINEKTVARQPQHGHRVGTRVRLPRVNCHAWPQGHLPDGPDQVIRLIGIAISSKRLLQSQRYDATIKAVEQIAGARTAAARRYSVLIRSVPIRDVLHDNTEGDIPQELVRRPVAG